MDIQDFLVESFKNSGTAIEDGNLVDANDILSEAIQTIQKYEDIPGFIVAPFYERYGYTLFLLSQSPIVPKEDMQHVYSQALLYCRNAIKLSKKTALSHQVIGLIHLFWTRILEESRLSSCEEAIKELTLFLGYSDQNKYDSIDANTFALLGEGYLCKSLFGDSMEIIFMEFVKGIEYCHKALSIDSSNGIASLLINMFNELAITNKVWDDKKELKSAISLTLEKYYKMILTE